MKRDLWRDRYRVDESSGCWVWTHTVTAAGYGKYDGRHAHRAVYESVVGAVASELHLDHLCRNTLCVNPAHMEPVTNAENQRRRAALQTHCLRGHEFTPENTYRRRDGGFRQCRSCRRVGIRVGLSAPVLRGVVMPIVMAGESAA